ncbi:MAG TPA: hypothetical protein VM577_13200 [Anaerovoracaceae bacterium]|nr:hypothetical protein [Anaerovoracaceae bacterium]
MNNPGSLNKPTASVFTELSQAVERLKQSARDKFNNDKNGSEDEYELAYLRGYFFGQLAALEDCYNLFVPFLSKISNENKDANLALKQQLMVAVKIVDDFVEKIEDNQSLRALQEYITLIEGTISLIKESSKNI